MSLYSHRDKRMDQPAWLFLCELLTVSMHLVNPLDELGNGKQIKGKFKLTSCIAMEGSWHLSRG